MNTDSITNTPEPEVTPVTPGTPTAATAPGIPEQKVTDSNVIDEKELAETEKELEELYKIRDEYNKLKAQPQGQQGLDPNALGQALANALQPMIPKPPPPQKVYDQEGWLQSDFKGFRSGLDELIKDRLDTFKEEQLKSVLQELGVIKSALPQLYLRAAENPQFSQIDQRAREIATQYGIEYWKAAQLAKDELSKQVTQASKTTPSVPSHMSAPDNRATNIPEIEESGPADFGDIMRTMRAKGIKF